MDTAGGNWHADPARRHRARWHDGTRWTDWVSDGGDPFRDPLDPAATAPSHAPAGTASAQSTQPAQTAQTAQPAQPTQAAQTTHTPGWFNDPTRRYRGRYYDGRQWTDWVSDGGEPQRDPAGAPHTDPHGAVEQPRTTRQPAAEHRPGAHEPSGRERPARRAAGRASGAAADGGPGPATAAGRSLAAATIEPAGIWKQLADVGPEVSRRPEPSLPSALGGAGGALAAAGVVAAFSGDSGNNAGRAIAGLLLIALGVFSGITPKATRELRAAGTAAAAVGIAIAAAALGAEMLSPTSGVRTLAVPLLVATAAYIAAWLSPGLRGRPLMIALGALSALLTVAVLLGGDSATALSTVLLLCAAGLLAFVVAADRRGLAGISTTAMVAALVATLAGLGVASLAATGEWGVGGSADCALYGICAAPSKTPLVLTGLLTFVVGLIVCLVGTTSGRRASSWYGAAISASGLVAFLVTVIEPTRALANGAVLIVAGAALAGVATLARQRLTTARDTGH